MKRIDAARLRAELVRPVGPYARLDVVTSTGSTNADLREALVEGAEDRTVLIAEEQTAGLGRRGRTWVSPSGAGVYCSVLFRPAGVSLAVLGSLASVAGLALMDLARELGVRAVLKWPNDVLASDGRGKVAGILAEAAASEEQGVILGVGLNVTPSREPVEPGPGGLPPAALSDLGARTTDRTEISRLLLTSLHERESAWLAGAGDLATAGLLEDYRAHCATLGQEVKIMIAGGEKLLGNAVDLDRTGALVVETNTGARRTIFAGDVVHLRPVSG
ncbi:biotin--[acetyl-CoA-carboxylase] ligase [Prauserella sp. PE36]|uniref:biotin--[biotin carboxyl-carrier protein] ligase n=1 Tax=Prauserella endophytica TaxID=1592324 RepID=A0ABY2RX85_9PSEU|nr:MULTISPECIES: biotin--[acetyl-CoA-carboxylase] ligase [Prauserella]PXY19804.1 biotin--[acetyl-CoA-carboxylase] ligase [Prauserella coralliicola]RBM18459.1 biotin--[acetyl-CoA-carboxylase] ligase [Prauserella sp. PE36]TKG64258.1 biotin--[acetyl-CoA-carboxylase] ligase [Prauserella endophytica]